MTRRFLKRKLAPPPAWTGAIARPRLAALLDAALAAGSHVGLFAGTGYGKTMLLADWARATQSRPEPPFHDRPPALAWLTLDAEDADLDAFLTYLVAAFEQREKLSFLHRVAGGDLDLEDPRSGAGPDDDQAGGGLDPAQRMDLRPSCA